jgi:hypothetical protein
MNRSSVLKKSAFAFWFAFLTAVAGIGAYYRMLTGFSIYDDEGTLLNSVKRYLSGAKLYEQIVLPYGPVYYFYNWAVRTLSGTPVTHDVVRISSLIPWLLTALVSAWIVYRFTDSLAIASVTHLLTSLILSNFFRNEPGHPQELCILLLVCLVAAGFVTSSQRWRLLGLILLGVLTAALLLVKVNIGTFAFLAVSLALLAHSPRTKLSRLAFYAVGAASVLLPLILMKSHLMDQPTRMYAVLVVASMIALLLILFRTRWASFFRSKDCWIALGAFAAAFVGVVLKLKVQGIGLNVMLHSLTIFVRRGSWYLPMPTDQGWLPWILCGLAAAVYFSWNAAKKNRMEDESLYLKLAVTIFAVLALLFGMQMIKLALPYCWLVLYGRPGQDRELNSFPRALLGSIAVLQTLYAYPIAGSQSSFILILPIIVVMTFLGDLAQWWQKKFSVIPPILTRAAASIVLLCVAASYFVTARADRMTYEALPSLQLLGAGRIHVPPAQAQDYQWLVQNLKDHCDIFVGFPELPSLHAWTEINPLAGMEVDAWILSASDEQQVAATVTLSEHPNACAISNPVLTGIWNRSNIDLDALPLVHYLNQNFKVVGTTGQFSFLVRKERDLQLESQR